MLRRQPERAALVGRLPEFDRLVLLGDTLELRHGPVREALAAASPVLSEMSAALGPGGEVVIVPGNHDHGLLRGWLERRDPASPLGLESVVDWDPREPLGTVVRSLARGGRVRVRVAYPGVWLRDDVYAIHGHYGDRHNTVPILERLGAGVTVRVAGEPEGGPARAEDYEAALAPMYAWADTIAQSGGLHLGGGGSFQVAAWQRLNGGAGRRSVRSRAMAFGLGVAIAGANRAGMGPLRSDVSGAALRRGALAGFTEVLARLGVPAAHVIFGHTHRAGPLPSDHRSEWGGTRLINTGSWVYEPRFIGPDRLGSPYRPGFAVIVGDDAPPELVNVLDPA